MVCVESFNFMYQARIGLVGLIIIIVKFNGLVNMFTFCMEDDEFGLANIDCHFVRTKPPRNVSISLPTLLAVGDIIFLLN
jgi:hypothetical protein